MADDFETPPAMPEKGFTPIMRTWWGDVLDWLVAHRPVGGTGGPLPDAAGGGKLIDLPPTRKGKDGTYLIRPWTPVPAPAPEGGPPEDANEPHMGFSPNSELRTRADEKVDVGVTASIVIPPDGSIFWLKVTVKNGQTNPEIDHAEVQYGAKTDWPGYPEPVELSSDPVPYQIAYRLLLCYIGPVDPDYTPAFTFTRPGATSRSAVIQCWSRNIIMTWVLDNGQVLLQPADPALDIYHE